QRGWLHHPEGDRPEDGGVRRGGGASRRARATRRGCGHANLVAPGAGIGEGRPRPPLRDLRSGVVFDQAAADRHPVRLGHDLVRAVSGTGRVVVVGLGPAGPDLVTPATLAAIERVTVRFVRTRRHPSVSVVGAASSFDDVYEHRDSIAAVYEEIVERLVTAAGEHREVLYAVPGSPAVGEHTVALLRERAAAGAIDVEVLPALSFADLAWARLGIDPLAAGVRIIDGHRFAVDAASERGPLLVAQCDSRAVLSDIKLALDLDGPPVVVLQRLGGPDETIRRVARAELDREVEPDHLTALYLDAAAPPVASEVARFDELVHVLRQRCPWDREQTHQSLTRHLLEETYEVLDALEQLDPQTGDGYEHLEEELGDLLFQICFHATLAAENGAFTLADVARTVTTSWSCATRTC